MSKQNTPSLVVMKSTLSRLPLYYSYISRLEAEGVESVSSVLLAQHLNLNPVLVRKDLAQVSSVAGHPRTGFEVKQLLVDIDNYMGYNKLDEAILVGVGSMGRILLTNSKFAKFGLNIVVGFDKDPYLCGLQLEGKHILADGNPYRHHHCARRPGAGRVRPNGEVRHQGHLELRFRTTESTRRRTREKRKSAFFFSCSCSQSGSEVLHDQQNQHIRR